MIKLPQTLPSEIELYAQKVESFLEGNISETEFKVFRVPMGIYEQRANGTYMVRIRCTGGNISPLSLQHVCDIANRYNSDLIHITTRQEIQIQNLSLIDTVSVISDLYQCNLTSRGGGGNTVRNIMAPVDSGISTTEIFDVFPYCVQLTEFLINQQSSWALPRKFKISFSHSEQDTAFALYNDLGFIAKIKDDIYGFSVYVGGSLSSQPMIGEKLFDFVSTSNICAVSEAVKQVFSKYGNRRNKHKARFRFLFYKYGKEQVFSWINTEYNILLNKLSISELPKVEYKSPRIVNYSKNEIINDAQFNNWKTKYVQRQKQEGFNSFEIPCKYGNFTPGNLKKLAIFFTNYGSDVFRFTMRQSIFVRNIPSSDLYIVYTFLLTHSYINQYPKLANSIVSCTGADTCRLGICKSKGALSAIQKSIIELPDLDITCSNVKINISGCPNSCGQHSNADIGFYGKVGRTDYMYPAYNVVLGGKIGEYKSKFAETIGEIAAKDISIFTREILLDFSLKYTEFKDFSEYSNSENPRAILQKFARKPSFEKQPDYFYDFNSDTQFSLQGRGAGECSAGIFDMIDVDYNAIQKLRKDLEKAQNKQEQIETAYNLAMYSSRMLLVTKGYDYKGNADIFKGFIECFINEGHISHEFTSLLQQLLLDDKEYLYLHVSEIMNLANDVCVLYNSLDESLQYPKSALINNEKSLAQTVVKDLRGVACPMNFVKTKIELAKMQKDELLEILLDDGAPIQNVPGSVRNEGHIVLEESQINLYWKVIIKKQ